MRRAALRSKKMHTNVTRASSEISTKSESAKPKTGAGASVSRVRKKIATKISEKRGEPYADTISYI